MATVGTVQVKIAVDSRNVGQQLQATGRQIQTAAATFDRTAGRVTALSSAFGTMSTATSRLGGQSTLLRSFGASANVAADAAQALAGATALGGLATLVSPAGLLIAGLAALVAWIYKSGEAARQAKKDLEDYKSFLGKLLPVELERNKANLEALIAQREQAMGGLVTPQQIMQRETAKLRERGEFRMPTLAELRAAGVGDAAENIKRATAALEAFKKQLQETNDQIEINRQTTERADLAEKLREAKQEAKELAKMLREVDAELRRMPEMSGRLAGRGLGVQFTPGQALPIGPISTGIIPNVPTGVPGPGGAFVPRDMRPPKIEIPDAVRAMYDTKFAIVQELKNVPGQIASSLAVFLGPIIAKLGVGGAIGASIGGAVLGGVGAGLGTRLAGSIGGNLGAAVGGAAGPLGMIVGTLAGGLIGSLFGGSDKRKRAEEEATRRLEALAESARRVNEAIFGLPAGVKIALSRFNATAVPETDDGSGPPGPTGPRPPTGEPRGGGDGRSRVVFTGPVTIQANDPEQLYRELGRVADREARRGGITALSLALRPMVA